MTVRVVLSVAGIAILLNFTPTHAGQAAGAQNSPDIYQTVYNGWKWWHVYCYRCHGMNAVGGTLAPNLIDPNARPSRISPEAVYLADLGDSGSQGTDLTAAQSSPNALRLLPGLSAASLRGSGGSCQPRPEQRGLIMPNKVTLNALMTTLATRHAA